MVSAWELYFAHLDAGTLGGLVLKGTRSAENVVVPPVWVFLLDVLLLRGSGALMVLTNLLSTTLAAACLARARIADLESGLAARGALAAILAVPLLSLVHGRYLARPVMILPTISLAGTFLAFTAATVLDARLARHPSSRVRWGLAGVGAGHLLASLSFGSGLAGWGGTLVLGAIRRWPRRVMVVLVGLMLATAALYLQTSGRAGSRIMSLGTRPAIDLLGHMVSYLASPLARALEASVATDLARRLAVLASGGALLGAGAWTLGWLAPSRRPPGRYQVLALQVLLYTVGVAFLVAAARSDQGVAQAFSPRYGQTGALFWVALLGLALGPGPRWRCRVLVAAGGLAALLVPAQRAGSRDLVHVARHLRPATLAMMVGVRDVPVLARIFPATDAVLRVATRLQRERLGLFAAPAAGWMGVPFAPRFQAQAGAPRGWWSASPVATDAAAAALTGELPAGTRAEVWVVLRDPEGKVVGLGRPVEPQATGRGPVPWRGYAAAAGPLEGYQAFAVDPESGAATPLAPRRVPEPLTAPAASAGASGPTPRGTRHGPGEVPGRPR